jgi:hypothetical protein
MGEKSMVGKFGLGFFSFFFGGNKPIKVSRNLKFSEAFSTDTLKVSLVNKD